MRNYGMHVAARQVRMLSGPLKVLDAVLARDAGLPEPPDYEWLPLMDMSEEDQATISKMRADTVGQVTREGLIGIQEGRVILQQDPMFEDLDPDAIPELPPAPEPPPGAAQRAGPERARGQR